MMTLERLLCAQVAHFCCVHVSFMFGAWFTLCVLDRLVRPRVPVARFTLCAIYVVRPKVPTLRVWRMRPRDLRRA